MTVRCYRWCERTKLHMEFQVWVGHYSRQKITENTIPRAVYLKMTRGVDWHPKTKTSAKQRNKLNANACGKQTKRKKEKSFFFKKKRPRKKLKTKACDKIVTKDKSTQMQELNEKMASLIRQANNWNQMARWKGWWKWRRKIKEKEGWKKIHYSHPGSKTVRGN